MREKVFVKTNDLLTVICDRIPRIITKMANCGSFEEDEVAILKMLLSVIYTNCDPIEVLDDVFCEEATGDDTERNDS